MKVLLLFRLWLLLFPALTEILESKIFMKLQKISAKEMSNWNPLMLKVYKCTYDCLDECTLNHELSEAEKLVESHFLLKFLCEPKQHGLTVCSEFGIVSCE